MTDLGCKVKKCIFHTDENLCSRNTITVGGADATNCSGTSCESYEKSGRDKATNDCGCGKAKIEITCEATNCRYNDARNCKAGHIDVKPCTDKSCGSTECASFELR